MQPKNSSKSSPAKAVPAKELIIPITSSSRSMQVDGKTIVHFYSGPTGNCQIFSLDIIQDELFLKALKQRAFPEQKRLIQDLLKGNKCLCLLTMPKVKFGKYFLDLLQKIYKKDNFKSIAEYKIGNKKYVKVLLRTYQ